MAERPAGAPTLEHLFIGAFALLGLRLGLQPIGDNSAFWHVRTGIDIVAGRGVPSTDPYSWTAAGAPWVVQSWLAEVVYGLAEALVGLRGVVVVNGLLLAVVAGSIALLARAGTPRRTAAAASVAIAVGVGWWSPRPLLFGLALLAATMLAELRGARWWWAAVIAALWVNLHGSFVLGFGWLALSAAGVFVDRRGRREPRHDRATLRHTATRLAGFGGGAVLGAAVSPPGLALLGFPLLALQRREAFVAVIEWQAPDLLAGPVEVLALGALVASGVLAIWRRPPLRVLLPAVAFAAAGLVSQRNLAPAAVALAPALGAALSADAPAAPLGAPQLNRVFGVVLAAAAAVFLVAVWWAPAIDDADYPVAAMDRLEVEGLRPPGTRIVHTDVTGGWLILRDGRDAEVFIDDRVDMYPVSLLSDYRALVAGSDHALQVLDRRRIELVVWPAGEPLLERLGEGRWQRRWAEGSYEVWVRA